GAGKVDGPGGARGVVEVGRPAGELGAAEGDLPPENLARPKVTVPPENSARLKSPPSKTTPVKSKFRPRHDISAVPFRWAVMTRMTVWRTSRLACKTSRCSVGASSPGSGS